jgi:acyl-CoA reductase-like NAD-dependent aldehyde dehydrogenase
MPVDAWLDGQGNILDRPADTLFIDGSWIPSVGGTTEPLLNPATGEVFGSAPAGTDKDCALAIAAARKAFDEGPWPRLSGEERSVLLHRMVEELEGQRAAIIELVMAETVGIRSNPCHWT